MSHRKSIAEKNTMNAQELLEFLLQAANAGIKLANLHVAFPAADPEFDLSVATEIEISDDQLLIS